MRVFADTHAVRLSGAVFALAAFMTLFAALVPAPSFATYADVATSYGSVAEVEPKGSSVPAADIPDGTYRNIDVRTSSSFCDVSNCTVKKSGTSLTATFTLTKTYTAIYLGTAEEAASKTDAAGEDSGSYVLGAEVQVGKRTLMRYTIALAALNSPFEVATFNGGSQSFTKACWYDRAFVFDSNSEVAMAVSSGIGPQESQDDDAEDDGQQEGDDGKDSSGEDGKDAEQGGEDSSGSQGASKAAKDDGKEEAFSSKDDESTQSSSAAEEDDDDGDQPAAE